MRKERRNDNVIVIAEYMFINQFLKRTFISKIKLLEK